MSANTGGPAFPVPADGATDGRTHDAGMTLLDWYAGQETICTEELATGICEHLAGPRPSGTWQTNAVEWYAWEAKWRAGIKYTRASAMLAEKARREAVVQECSTTQDAGKMVELQAANRELVEALEACNAAFLKFAPQDESAYGAAWVKVRTILAKHKGAA